jgi:DNA-binding protein HU-beta
MRRKTVKPAGTAVEKTTTAKKRKPAKKVTSPAVSKITKEILALKKKFKADLKAATKSLAAAKKAAKAAAKKVPAKKVTAKKPAAKKATKIAKKPVAKKVVRKAKAK